MVRVLRQLAVQKVGSVVTAGADHAPVGQVQRAVGQGVGVHSLIIISSHVWTVSIPPPAAGAGGRRAAAVDHLRGGGLG